MRDRSSHSLDIDASGLIRSMSTDVLKLLPARRGHFVFESGHHGELWLDLERLCLHPEPIQKLADALAARLAKYQLDAVCGPLVEGAFVALMVASRMQSTFTYAERFVDDTTADKLYPVRYRIPR